MTSDEFVRSIAEITIGASPDELRVVLAVAERLRMGRDAYGQLAIATDRRDWDREMRDELLDAIVYGTIAEMATVKP